MSATAKAQTIEKQIEDTDARVRLAVSTFAEFKKSMIAAREQQNDRSTVCFGELETQIRDVQEDVASLRRQINEFRAWVNGVVTAQTEMSDIINLAQKALESGKPRRKK